MLALTFQIGDEKLAIDIRRVREVIPRVRLQRVSGSPDWQAGVFVYRGTVAPVVDLHRLAGAGPCPPHLSSRIILIETRRGAGGERLIGLLASQVADTREVSTDTQQVPSMADAERFDFGPLLSDANGILRLFDPDRFLPEAAWQKLMSVPERTGT